jgi:hypothetical protein
MKTLNFERGQDPLISMQIGLSGDIKKLCEGVLETSTIFYDNPDGPYENSCPFCGVTMYTGGNEGYPSMSDLNHREDCVYLLAKKLIKKLE